MENTQPFCISHHRDGNCRHRKNLIFILDTIQMTYPSPGNYLKALHDFQNARRKAATENILAKIYGKSAALLSYDDYRQKLKGVTRSGKKLQDIPLDAIVGSVGRYTDFTRRFFPKHDSDASRWTSVKMATEDFSGLPPIEVYQIGNYYFVLDGHHRVSIARQYNTSHIQAYVTKVETEIPFVALDQPHEQIIAVEHQYFLQETHLDKVRPKADITISLPGKYQDLLEHISVHRYFMGIDQNREISKEEAVVHWFDNVYQPIIKIIQQHNLLKEFPARTETDLYIYITSHQTALAEELNWEITPDDAAVDFANRFTHNPLSLIKRMFFNFIEWITPDEIESGPLPGEWRRQHITAHITDRLFESILVAIPGDDNRWWAMDMALEVARREEAWLGGLHIIPSEKESDHTVIEDIKNDFLFRCEKAGISGKLAVETGNTSRKIWERSRWADLVVLRLSYPPPLSLIPRLNSGFRKIILRSVSPVLAVPETFSKLDSILLAYDGSPKAEEALFVAAYLACRWHTILTVISVMDSKASADLCISEAGAYLENNGVPATFISASGNAADKIIGSANSASINLIIMGGYGSGPLIEMISGSTVDKVLAKTAVPVLICK